MENLLPHHPAFEVMIGKIAPYLLIGLVQVTIILSATRWLFGVPFLGSLSLLLVGHHAVYRRQPGWSASPSQPGPQPDPGHADDLLLLPPLHRHLRLHVPLPRHAALGTSGIGELLPTTHFIRISRGIMLRGNTFIDIWPELWPLLLFTALVMAIGLRRFRRTWTEKKERTRRQSSRNERQSTKANGAGRS
jgi:ABC-2 type transport system permease protein